MLTLLSNKAVFKGPVMGAANLFIPLESPIGGIKLSLAPLRLLFFVSACRTKFGVGC